MSNFEHAKYDADGVRIDDPTFNTQALRNDTSLVNGITFPAANTVAINTNSVERLRVGNEGQTTILAASSSPALKVTQTGAGNAFVVEDSASTDATPFVIDASGNVAIGLTSPSGNKLLVADETSIGYVGRSTGSGGSPITLQRHNTSLAAPSVVASGNVLGQVQFTGYDGSAYIQAANVIGYVDGTPGTNDMPGRLVFSTTADGASSPTEALRIDSTQSITNTAAGSGTNAYGFRVTSAKTGGTNNYAFSGEIAAGTNRYNLYMSGTADNYFAGSVGIGALPYAGTDVVISKALTGATSGYGMAIAPTVNSDVTSAAYGIGTYIGTQAASFTLPILYHFSAGQNVIGAGSTVTNQIGFSAASGLTGATNNYGFYGAIAAGTNRWNFYAAGTAANYFAGDLQLGKTVTAGGTTGAQTINKTTGSVNFAAAATSLVVTNSLVTTSSIIVATVATNDATMKSVAVVAAAGSFTLHANAAATAETRVNFCVFN